MSTVTVPADNAFTLAACAEMIFTDLPFLDRAQRIAARTYEPFWLYLEAAVIYLAFTTILSRIQVWGEKKLQHYDY